MPFCMQTIAVHLRKTILSSNFENLATFGLQLFSDQIHTLYKLEKYMKNKKPCLPPPT